MGTGTEVNEVRKLTPPLVFGATACDVGGRYAPNKISISVLRAGADRSAPLMSFHFSSLVLVRVMHQKCGLVVCRKEVDVACRVGEGEI